MKRFTLQANGEGEFTAPQLSYRGRFVNGKFHDLTGNASCVFDSVHNYTGGFEDGHFSGPGDLGISIGGQLHRIQGDWRQSRLWTGRYCDEAGDEIMVVEEGIRTLHDRPLKKRSDEEHKGLAFDCSIS